MPRHCNQLPDEVDIRFDDGSVVTYTTQDRFTNSSYCYKPAGSQRPHFTVVDTQGGRALFRRFHITDDWGGSGEVRVFYHEDEFENYAPLGLRVHQSLREAWDRIAQSFWEEMSR